MKYDSILLVQNEKKPDPKDKLSRKDIVEIHTEDHGIPVATAYRYYKDQLNLYKWETSKPDPGKQLKDNTKFSDIQTASILHLVTSK